MDQTPFTPGPTPPPGPRSQKPAPTPDPATPPVWHLIVNAGAFQAVWFACVLGAASGHSWPGVLAAAVAIALHLLLVEHRAVAVGLIILATAIGFFGETALIWSDSVRYTLGADTRPFPPPWLLAMWAAFGTLPQLSLRWLQARPLFASIVGLMLGPLAYLAGEQLGGILIARPLLYSIDGIAVLWEVSLPLLLIVCRSLTAPSDPDPPHP